MQRTGERRRSVFCGTLLGVSATGRYPASCSVELGLSSRPASASTREAGDHPSGVDGDNLHPGRRACNGHTGDVKAQGAWLAAGALALAGCGAGPLVLDAPDIARAVARAPSPVEVEPIADGAAIVGDYMPPGPAAVLTAAMNTELAGRALHGGESGGYSVRCTLDRFAVRSHASRRAWRRRRRGSPSTPTCRARPPRARPRRHVAGRAARRAVAEGSNLLGSGASVRQRCRPGVLRRGARDGERPRAPRARPAGRAERPRLRRRRPAEAAAGLDDSPFGAAALEQNGAPSSARAKGSHDGTRTCARARGTSSRWRRGRRSLGRGREAALDDEPRVRFVQYKALARHGGDAALAQLRRRRADRGRLGAARAAGGALATRGIGVARGTR